MKTFTRTQNKTIQLLKVRLAGQYISLLCHRPSHQTHLTEKLHYFIKLCYLKSWVWMDFFFKILMS